MADQRRQRRDARRRRLLFQPGAAGRPQFQPQGSRRCRRRSGRARLHLQRSRRRKDQAGPQRQGQSRHGAGQADRQQREAQQGGRSQEFRPEVVRRPLRRAGRDRRRNRHPPEHKRQGRRWRPDRRARDRRLWRRILPRPIRARFLVAAGVDAVAGSQRRKPEDRQRSDQARRDGCTSPADGQGRHSGERPCDGQEGGCRRNRASRKAGQEAHGRDRQGGRRRQETDSPGLQARRCGSRRRQRRSDRQGCRHLRHRQLQFRHVRDRLGGSPARTGARHGKDRPHRHGTERPDRHSGLHRRAPVPGRLRQLAPVHRARAFGLLHAGARRP